MISLIDAGPGTGKSFTIKYGYLHVSKQLIGGRDRMGLTDEQETIFNYLEREYDRDAKVCFFAHNNSTKDKLVSELPKGTNVYTFHGAGQSHLIKRYGYQRLVGNRLDNFIKLETGQDIRDMPWPRKMEWWGVKKIVNHFKAEDLTPSVEALSYIKTKYPDMSVAKIPDDWDKKADKLLALSKQPNKTVEFSDMVYMANHCIQRPTYDLGFVDESQDVSASTYKLVTRLCSHVVFCGDKNQAINGFAGASEEMYERIAKVSDAILPLKMTLRCPPNIVDLANSIRAGGVTKGPNTEPGHNTTVPYASLPEKLKTLSHNNVLICSRINAAIVSCAVMLRNEGIPCIIRNKDLHRELTNFVKSFNRKKLPDLSKALNQYEEKAQKSPNAMWGVMCKDKCDAVRSLMKGTKTFNELIKNIEETFDKPKDGAYTLTTLHGAKGLEADNVFILNPPIELPVCMSHPIAREQEINLAFVGVTRVRRNLYWVK